MVAALFDGNSSLPDRTVQVSIFFNVPLKICSSNLRKKWINEPLNISETGRKYWRKDKWINSKEGGKERLGRRNGRDTALGTNNANGIYDKRTDEKIYLFEINKHKKDREDRKIDKEMRDTSMTEECRVIKESRKETNTGEGKKGKKEIS